jgi:hypothetical protein
MVSVLYRVLCKWFSAQLEMRLLKSFNALVKTTNAVYQAGQLAIPAKRSPEIVVSLVQR